MTERDVKQMDRVFIGGGEYVKWSAAVAAVQAANTRAAAQAAELALYREALEAISASAYDDDGWTSDGHERCTEAATAALTHAKGEKPV